MVANIFSFDIKKKETIFANSDDNGLATCNDAANTVTLSAEILDYASEYGSFYFEDDNYTQGYPYVSNVGAVYTVSDPGASLPDGADKKWIYKCKNYVAPMDVHDFETYYEEVVTPYSAVNSSDVGAND